MNLSVNFYFIYNLHTVIRNREYFIYQNRHYTVTLELCLKIEIFRIYHVNI